MKNINNKVKGLLFTFMGIMFMSTVISASVTTYEDANSLNTSKWSIYSNESGTATVTNVYDNTHSSNVIEFSGNGLNDGFKIGATRGTSRWNNSKEKTLTWEMKYSEDVAIYVALKTTNGSRYLKYTNHDTSNGLDRGKIHHGLGSEITDGTWRTFSRDLEADLQTFDPLSSITAVDAFYIRGSGKIDNIMLMSQSTVYEDAEDTLTTGWKISTNTLGDASIMNEFDANKTSKVITFLGNGLEDAYTLGAARGADKWDNKTERNLSWSMNYGEDVVIIISLATNNGTRYIQYENNDIDLGIHRGKIHHALGSDIIDGTWRTFNRDLEADLKKFEPTNFITAVNAFTVKGSGKVDDIKLSSSILDKPTIVLNGNENITLNLGDSYIDAGASATDTANVDITADIYSVNMVTTTTPGSFVITYDVKDSNGIWAEQVTRSITVIDNSINNPPSASNIYISGNIATGSIITLNYTFEDIDGDNEGASTIVWSTVATELYRGEDKSFVIPAGYEGKAIYGYLRVRDEHGLEHDGQYGYVAVNSGQIILPSE